MSEVVAENSRPAGDQVQQPVEVDSEATDNDSAYGNELSGYTASLTSSVLNYREENGRRYHGYRDGNYLLPNDEEESERLDMIHSLMKEVMDGKLFFAPVSKHMQKALDLGTGTGIWAIELGDDYPSAEVIGNDLSPTQPSLVPPNVRFIVEDFEDEWAYPPNHFDFIHARFLACCVKDYAKLIKRSYEHTAPGGWVEFHDWNPKPYSEDNSLQGSSLDQYYTEVLDGFKNTGYVISPGPNLEQWVRDAGFVDVQVWRHRVPIGIWPKDKKHKKIGMWTILQYEQGGFEAGAMAILTRFKNWKEEEVKILSAKARNDMRSRKVHAMFDFYAVYGRKPEPA